MKRAHAMPFGATVLGDGRARFRLWAPSASDVTLVQPDTDVSTPMRPCGDGWYELEARATSGSRYAYRIDGDVVVPDPASRSNPDDVHGASRVVDPGAFDWPDERWRGRPWHEAVVYELHVGTFTAEGTFAALVPHLDELVALGITAIELMPVADFPGRRGWGYDGVLPYAPESSYGSPEDLKHLVAEAHRRGLMVLLDVVYNHFGPDGNYLWVYAKPFFNADVHTPWGAAINFDGVASRTVRDFFIHNALYWLEEFHFDGLRLDAVHAMHDRSPLHFVDELAQAVRAGPGRERHVHLVLENDHNEAVRLQRAPDGGVLLADAQWNDDLHHAAHVLVTGESDGYYADYADDPVGRVGRTLAEGFGYQGEASDYRGGAPRGEPSGHLPPSAFVNSLQTHDQIGNRAMGERLGTLADECGRGAALRALTECLLLAPSIPMLYMGEEYAASTPFLYFCDFSGDLARAVTEGRRAEFGRFARFADPALRARIPDPNAEATFRRSVLDRGEASRMPHSAFLALVRELLRARHRHLVPWLDGAASGTCQRPTTGTLHCSWPLRDGRRWHLLAQLADEPAPAEVAAALVGRVVYASARAGADANGTPDAVLPPWSVIAALEG